MFNHGRRGRSIALALLVATARAANTGVFFAKSVSYCSTSRAIDVSTFLLEYDTTVSPPTIFFNIVARSVEPNLNATLSLQLVAYGITAVDTSFDLCSSVLGGIVCPLPMVEFDGSDTLTIPANIASSISIPGIAYVIPDLDATAYVRLISNDDGSEAACLKVGLSNGLSTRFNGVSWATAGIAIGSILVSMIGLGVGLAKGLEGNEVQQGRRKERLLVIMGYFQFIATTGLMSISYPAVFTAFTANLAWSLGLVFISSVQQSIDITRSRTGGNLTQLAGQVVGGRQALDYTLSGNFRRSSSSLIARSSPTPSTSTVQLFLEAMFKNYQASTTALSKRFSLPPGVGIAAYSIPSVTNGTSTDDVTGFFNYITSLIISPYNAFLTVLVSGLLLFAGYIILAGLWSSFVMLGGKGKEKWNEKMGEKMRMKESGRVGMQKEEVWCVVRANALRLLLICLYPLLIFTFFSWTIGKTDSYVPILLSTLFTVGVSAGLGFILVRTLLSGRKGTLELRSRPSKTLFNAYREKSWWFFLPVIFAVVLRAIFLAFARDHGIVQSIGLVVVEGLLLIAMIAFRPFTKKTTNWLGITYQILRLLVQGALISFNANLNLMPIPKVIVGIVLIIVQAVGVIGLFVLVVIDAFSVLFLAIRKRSSSRDSDLEGLDEYEPRTREREMSGASGAGSTLPSTRTSQDDRASLTLAELIPNDRRQGPFSWRR